jgi:hypothetical protein
MTTIAGRARLGLGLLAVASGLFACLTASARGSDAVVTPLVGCHERVEGSRPTPRFKGLIAVPGVLRLGTPKRAYIPGRGVTTPEGMVYKIPAGVNARVPAKTVLLSAVDPGVMLHYGFTTARSLRLRACKPGTPGFSTNPPVGQWTGWSGGIIVPEIMCVHLLVKEGTRTHHVNLGLGVRCPQANPSTR